MARLLIGGYSGEKGNGSGVALIDGDQVTTLIPAESPSWIGWHPSLPVLYAVAETDQGRVHAWELADSGPVLPRGSAETGGAEPAHLAVDPSGRFLITANYSGGSISVHELGPQGQLGRRTDLVQHELHGEHPRQAGAHPHMVRAVSGGLLVIDLGGDAIYQYELTQDGRLELSDVATAPAGSGPRHVLPVGDRYYVTAELTGEVLSYDQDWNFVGAVAASLTEGKNQPSELASDGRYLYVANRGPDAVSVFRLDRDLPRQVTEVPVGVWPRHIYLDGELLYVANERSHEVITMRIDPQTGIPARVQAVGAPSPTCILPWPKPAS
ncbi:MAG: lactonase family protein [Streptosporangiaceae bacterium]